MKTLLSPSTRAALNELEQLAVGNCPRRRYRMRAAPTVSCLLQDFKLDPGGEAPTPFFANIFNQLKDAGWPSMDVSWEMNRQGAKELFSALHALVRLRAASDAAPGVAEERLRSAVSALPEVVPPPPCPATELAVQRGWVEYAPPFGWTDSLCSTPRGGAYSQPEVEPPPGDGEA